MFEITNFKTKYIKLFLYTLKIKSKYYIMTVNQPFQNPNIANQSDMQIKQNITQILITDINQNSNSITTSTHNIYIYLSYSIQKMQVGFRQFQRLFSTNPKYFKDKKLINLQLITDDRLQSMHKLTGIFSRHRINMTYIKTHLEDFKVDLKKQYTIFVSIQNINQDKINKLVGQLENIGVHTTFPGPIQVPWFPKQQADVDHLGRTLLQVKDQANRDHLQFTDQQYRKRRDYIAEIAINYKMGHKIPNIDYKQQQTEMWSRVYKKLRKLHKNSMSQRYEYQMQRMNSYFKLQQKIPQLNELSQYLQSQTGFTIKPVHGIVSQRQFLNCFAYKTFPSTQYLRHTKTPDYTPQPDIVHQIVGHVPMFSDKDVAEISHKIGLISLGASDEQIAKLGTLYWYSLQFGACKENGRNLGYGAGIASSIGEIQHFSSDKAKFKAFQPKIDCTMPFPIQTVQDTYRVTESFQKSLNDLQEYGKSILKPISTSYNFVTKSVIYDRNIEAISAKEINPYQ